MADTCNILTKIFLFEKSDDFYDTDLGLKWKNVVVKIQSKDKDERKAKLCRSLNEIKVLKSWLIVQLRSGPCCTYLEETLLETHTQKALPARAVSYRMRHQCMVKVRRGSIIIFWR